MAKKRQADRLPVKIDTPDNRALSAPVSSVVKVESIRLVGCHTKGMPTSTAVRQQLHVEHRPIAERIENRLLVTIDVHVWTQAEAAERAVDIYATFLLTYDVGDHQFDQANLDAFAALNGMFNLWPYVREFVQSMTVRMGLPALTLPVHRPGAMEVKAIAAVEQSENKKIQSQNTGVAAAQKKRATKKR
jgi:preprotein translocase subunit SecB